MKPENYEARVTHGLPGKELMDYHGIHGLRAHIEVEEIRGYVEELYSNLSDIPELNPDMGEISITHTASQSYDSWEGLEDYLENEELSKAQGIKTKITGEFGQIQIHYNPMSKATALGGKSPTKSLEALAKVTEQEYQEDIGQVLQSWSNKNSKIRFPSLF